MRWSRLIEKDPWLPVDEFLALHPPAGCAEAR